MTRQSRRTLVGVCLALAAAGPAPAQEVDPDAPPGLPPGYDTTPYADGELMRRGVELFLRGFMAELDPAMRQMTEMLEAWRLEDFTVGDLSAYHPPEMLPNGDIILRRRTPPDADPGVPPLRRPDPLAVPPDDEVEL